MERQILQLYIRQTKTAFSSVFDMYNLKSLVPRLYISNRETRNGASDGFERLASRIKLVRFYSNAFTHILRRIKIMFYQNNCPILLSKL